MRWVMISLATLFLFCTDAIAADIRILSRQAGGAGCHILLKGSIDPGDSSKLFAVLHDLERSFAPQLQEASMAALYGDRNPILCLDSSGGSWVEGLSIAQHLVEPNLGEDPFILGVTTRIEAGNECLSACALIFMAGQFFDRGGERIPSRFLDVRGRLGFHAPYLDPNAMPIQRYTPKEMAAAHEAATSSIQSAMKLFNFPIVEENGGLRNRPWVSPSLFVDMLSRPSNELFLIDTVGKAGRLDIGLIGARIPPRLTPEAAKTACANFLAWRNDLPKLGDDGPSIELVPRDAASDTTLNDDIHDPELVRELRAKDFVYKIGYSRKVMYCGIALFFSEPEIGIGMTIVSFKANYNYPLLFPVWAAEDPDLPIAKLAGSERMKVREEQPLPGIADPGPAEEEVLQAVRRYYGYLNDANVDAVLSSWLSPPRSLSSLAASMEYARINNLSLKGNSGAVSTVQAEVTVKSRGGAEEQWRLDLELKRIGGSFRIRKMANAVRMR